MKSKKIDKTTLQELKKKLKDIQRGKIDLQNEVFYKFYFSKIKQVKKLEEIEIIELNTKKIKDSLADISVTINQFQLFLKKK